MLLFFCRKCRGLSAALPSCLLISALVWNVSAHAASADFVNAGDRWQICAGSATAPAALGKIAARVAARLGQEQGQGSERVQVRLVPQAEGSTEVLLAATTELIDQLRARLVANRVPLRTVDFQWLSEQDADPHWEKAEVCRGVMVRIEVTVEG